MGGVLLDAAGTALRNIFDQYSQPENRVTHALITALNEDRNLLGLFLRELVKVKAPCHPNKLSVLEQQYPGEEEPGEEELERRGIPDGWIFDEEGWCVLIETKVLANLDASQIFRHRRTAERRGFHSVTAVAIVPRRSITLPPDIVLLEWRTIYAWLRRYGVQSRWAARAAEYLELAEAKLIATGQFVEGTLTMFSGFPFGREHPFTYLEGKRIMSLALGELRNHSGLKVRLGMNPKAPGRPAITGSQGEGVWDFLSILPKADGNAFTKHAYLTLAVNAHGVEATVTVPNAVNRTTRRNLVQLGEAGFQKLAEDIVQNLAPLLRAENGAVPRFWGVQRRYPSPKAKPFVDANTDFDLRTAIPAGGAPKTQPRWLSAAYGCFVNKEGSNYQIDVGVLFPYESCPKLRQPEAIGLLAAAWLACKPLVDLARD